MPVVGNPIIYLFCVTEYRSEAPSIRSIMKTEILFKSLLDLGPYNVNYHDIIVSFLNHIATVKLKIIAARKDAPFFIYPLPMNFMFYSDGEKR